MSKLSILQISPFFYPNIGGVETHLSDLLSYLQAHEINNTVITYQPLVSKQTGKAYERSGQTEIYRVGWIKGIFYKTEKNPIVHFLYLTPVLMVRSILIMKKIQKRIDIIHCHGINAAVIGAVLKGIYKKPLIVSFHVEFNLPPQATSTKFILSCLKQADKILVLTQRSRQALIDLGFPAEKVEAYSYWVNQELFKVQNRESLRKKLKWDSKFTVLFVGRLAEEKGVNLLIEVAKKMPEVRFVFIGGGELETIVQKASQDNSNLFFLGRVDNKKLPVYYNSADVLVVPSLVKKPRPAYEEGVPRVIIEALSCCLPVIGTDNGGIKEVITNGKVGMVVESEVNSLVLAIKQILRSPQKLKKYKQRARKFVLDRFSQKNGATIKKAYESVSANQRNQKNLYQLLDRVGDMALKRRSKSVITGLELAAGKKILDVGCGDGFYLHLLSNLRKDLKLIGTDFDQNGLNSASRNLDSRKIPLVQADLMKRLPFLDNQFDGVVMSEVAEHLPDDKKGLKEVYRILKSNGLLVLTVPCQNYPFLWDPVNYCLEHLTKRHVKSGFWAGIWNQHVRLYQPKQIESVLKSAGFTIEQSELQTYWCLPFSHNLINFGARLLTSEKLSTSIKELASKFSNKKSNQINLAIVFFIMANAVDKLNEIFPAKRSGVSIFIKAIKPQ